MRLWKLAMVAPALAGLAACETEGSQSMGGGSVASTPATTGSAGETSGSATSANTGGMVNTGGTTAGTGGTTPGTGGSSGSPGVPTLINVNLQNVLNNLSVSLSVDRNSVPVTAQVPIDVAAAVCGVSVDALAASVASGRGTCTATTTSPQLNQIVQQQISTGGNVQGGDQTLNTGGGTPR